MTSDAGLDSYLPVNDEAWNTGVSGSSNILVYTLWAIFLTIIAGI
jgi:hypothetical protein